MPGGDRRCGDRGRRRERGKPRWRTPTLEAVPGPGAVTTDRTSRTRRRSRTTAAARSSRRPGTSMTPPVVAGVRRDRARCEVVLRVVSTRQRRADAATSGNSGPGRAVDRLTVVWNVPAGARTPPGCHGLPRRRTAPGSSTRASRPTATRPSREAETAASARRRARPSRSTSSFRPAATRSRAARRAATSLSTNQAIYEAQPRGRPRSACPFHDHDGDRRARDARSRSISGANIARQSEVCVAALGQNCPGAAPAADFGSSTA